MFRPTLLYLVTLFVCGAQADLHKHLRRQETLSSCLGQYTVAHSTPSSADYATARYTYNARYDYKPAAIARPTTPEGISAALKCAARLNVGVVARGGGHSYIAGGQGGKDGMLIVDVASWQEISVDQSSKIATVGAGQKLGNIYLALDRQGGRAISAGHIPSVGIGGHACHGGVGTGTREHGLTLDQMVSVDLVLANGTVTTASKTQNPELFWGMQGAGSSFGIVYRYRFNTHASPAKSVSFHFVWIADPYTCSRAALALQEWNAEGKMDRRMGLSFHILAGFAPAGQLKFEISGTHHGDAGSFWASMGHLTDALPPRTETQIQYDLSWIQSLESKSGGLPLDQTNAPRRTEVFYANSLISKDLSEKTWADLCYYMAYDGRKYGGVDGQPWWMMQMHLDGGPDSAYSSVPDDATSFGRRSGTTWIGHLWFVNWNGSPLPQEGINFLDGMVGKVASNEPAGTDYGAYLNYPSTNTDDFRKRYYGSNYPRLAALKRAVDPQNLFSGPLNVTP